MNGCMKFAICNELFEGWEFDRVCRFVKDAGYDGLEVAPFTLAPLITDVPAARRVELRQQAADAGVEIIGLHWLLAKTEGFYLTSPDKDVRQRTAAYLVALAEACRDFGGDLMVFGSPKQRSLLPGVSREQAFELGRRHIPAGPAGHCRRRRHALHGAAVAGRDRLRQHLRRRAAARRHGEPSEHRPAPRREGDAQRADAADRLDPDARRQGRATFTSTTRTCAGPDSATSTSCRSSRRSPTPATSGGCRWRCSTTSRIPKRSPGRAWNT